MVDPNTRQGKRTPVTLKIKFKSETLEQFIERYAVDVSQGGIFIRTKEPLAVGTQMRFEFQLRDASPLIAGEGTVVWTRENDPSRPAIAPGMGVRFDRLAEGSQTVLERILSEKAKQAPQRTGHDSTKPPLFTDTPTRVAPMSVQDALLGDKRRGPADDSSHTPLPKPMPFHSDAEDFDEQAFEEATKVRALDELIAQTADSNEGVGNLTAIIPPDELAARRIAAGGRADGTVEDEPLLTPPQKSGPIGVGVAKVDRDSAPGLPNPPAANPKMLDAAPSAHSVETPAADHGKTRLGVTAPKSTTTPPATKSTTTPPLNTKSTTTPPANRKAEPLKDTAGRPSGNVPVAQAIENEPSRPIAPRKKSSAAPMAVLILLLIAAVAGGVWFFYLRPKAEEANRRETVGPGSGTAVAVDAGSAGTGAAVAPPVVTPDATAMAGSNTGSAAVAPKAPVVDTVIGSSVDKANVAVVDTDQAGVAPFTAKLEKDRVYKVRVASPGFVSTEMEVKGGQDKVVAKLAAKPRIISLTSEPTGALVFVDNAATGHSTPYEVELTAAQAAKKSVRITLKKGGFQPTSKVVSTENYVETDAKLVAEVAEKLPAAAPVVRPPPPPRPSPAAGSNAGSATPPDPAGGSAAPPPPPPTPSAAPVTPPAGTGSASTKPPAGTGSAATKPPAGSGSSASTKPAEPEPDFAKK